MITRLPLLCLLAGSTLLTGCFLTPADETTPAAAVQPSVQTTKTGTVQPQPQTNPKPKPKPKPPAAVTQKSPPKSVTRQAAATVKTIKPGSASALKVGQKLSPQEVEDLIRKLSVCRPS